MLTAEENAQLTRVGPGTLIGDLMRQYWIPVVLSSERAPGGWSPASFMSARGRRDLASSDHLRAMLSEEPPQQ